MKLCYLISFLSIAFLLPGQINGKNLRELSSVENKQIVEDGVLSSETTEESTQDTTSMFYDYDRYERILGYGDEEAIYEAVTSKSSKYKMKIPTAKSVQINMDGSSSSLEVDQSPLMNANTKFGAHWNQPQSSHHSTGGTQKWPWCAWPVSVDAHVFTPLLMDPNAVYQAQLIEFAEDDQDGKRVYRFRSSYQEGVYFSYTAYAIRGKYASSLQDTHIKPHWGCNPYTDLDCTRETSGGYELYITRYGDTGRYANEIGMIEREKEFLEDTTYLGSYDAIAELDKTLGTILLRIYWPRELIDVWGNVDPPILEVSNDYGATFTPLDQCSENDSLRFNRFLKRIYHRRQPRNYDFLDPNVPSPFYLSSLDRDYPKENRRRDHCPLYNQISEKEVLYNPAFYPQINSAEAEGEHGFEPYSNPDSDYLFYCNIYQPSIDDIAGTKTFLDNYLILGVIDGHADIAPDGLYYGEGIRVADSSAWQTRYGSFETAETTIPQPSFASISLANLQEKYGPDWDRRYRILTTPTTRANFEEQESSLRTCYNNLQATGKLENLSNDKNYDFYNQELPYLPFVPTHGIEPTPENDQFYPLIPTWIYRLQAQKDEHIKSVLNACSHLPAGSEERQRKCFDKDSLQKSFPSYIYPNFNLYLCDKHTNQGVKFTGEKFEEIINNAQYTPIY